MKWLFIILLAFAASCTNSDVDNTNQQTTDSGSRKSIDTSAIINQDTRLPSDTMKTTVNH